MYLNYYFWEGIKGHCPRTLSFVYYSLREYILYLVEEDTKGVCQFIRDSDDRNKAEWGLREGCEGMTFVINRGEIWIIGK